MNPYPPTNPPALGRPPMRLLPILAIAGVVLLAIVGIAAYLVGYGQGQSAIQHATLRLNIENRMDAPLSVTVLVNEKVRQVVQIPAGQTTTLDEGVTFAGADGAYFVVEASAVPGLRDSDSVLVASPGIYVVSLKLG